MSGGHFILAWNVPLPIFFHVVSKTWSSGKGAMRRASLYNPPPKSADKQPPSVPDHKMFLFVIIKCQMLFLLASQDAKLNTPNACYQVTGWILGLLTYSPSHCKEGLFPATYSPHAFHCHAVLRKKNRPGYCKPQYVQLARIYDIKAMILCRMHSIHSL